GFVPVMPASLDWGSLSQMKKWLLKLTAAAYNTSSVLDSYCNENSDEYRTDTAKASPPQDGIAKEFVTLSKWNKLFIEHLKCVRCPFRHCGKAALHSAAFYSGTLNHSRRNLIEIQMVVILQKGLKLNEPSLPTVTQHQTGQVFYDEFSSQQGENMPQEDKGRKLVPSFSLVGRVAVFNPINSLHAEASKVSQRSDVRPILHLCDFSPVVGLGVFLFEKQIYEPCMCLTAMAWDAARRKGSMNTAGSQIHMDREVQEQCLLQLWLCFGFRTALKYREEGFYGCKSPNEVSELSNYFTATQ
ncbi:hypothetical protein EK904_012463, partial [Melospiza melodia maxima]